MADIMAQVRGGRPREGEGGGRGERGGRGRRGGRVEKERRKEKFTSSE